MTRTVERPPLWALLGTILFVVLVPGTVVGGVPWWLTRWRLARTLASQLQELGLKPSDVRYVAASHTHFDHIGNVELFPEAMLLVQKAEYEWPSQSGGARFSILWSFAYAMVNNVGFANIMPVGLALYSRAAPRGLQGVMIGIYYLHLFFGNTFVGWLAGLLETMPGSKFWMLHAALVAAAGVGLLLVKLVFGRLLAPEDEPARTAAA